MKRKKINFSKLVRIMKKLLGPNGCPWDKKQTHRSIFKCLLKEVKEFERAVIKNDYENMKEELGDILLCVVFHSELASKEGYFSISDVIDTLNEKLIRRHPHVFGGLKVKNVSDVVKNWVRIKKLEKKGYRYGYCKKDCKDNFSPL